MRRRRRVLRVAVPSGVGGGWGRGCSADRAGGTGEGRGGDRTGQEGERPGDLGEVCIREAGFRQ